MFRIIIFLGALLIAGSAFADDPGVRDSLIIETVYAELGDTAVDVRAYATTDDSVWFYNFPVTWNSSCGAGIYPFDVSYYNLLIHWMDNYDTLLYDQVLLRIVGWCGDHDEPPLITNNQRMHCWTIHFSVDSLDLPQYLEIDTTFDHINGSLLFALGDGITDFAPVFIPGAIYYGITSGASDDDRILPEEIALIGNYPNPFNASTTIEFTLPEEAVVELSIYNILGRKVAVICDEIKQAGDHQVTWNAREYPSGVYFALLETGDISKSVKMVLLK